MSTAKSDFIQAGRHHVAALDVFNKFVDAIRPLSQEIPTLRFDEPAESRIDFQYRDMCFRFQLRGGYDDKQSPTACIVSMVKPDPDDEKYNPLHKLVIIRDAKLVRGRPGVSGLANELFLSADGHFGVANEEAFYYLLLGKK